MQPMKGRALFPIVTMLALTIFVSRASARSVAAPPENNAHGAESVAHRTAESGEAGAAEHGQVEHKSAPLLPSNLEEFKEYFLGPAIWTIVIFVVLLALLIPTAWKNVLIGLKQREQRIRSDIADAEAARAKAEATLREYNNQLASAENRVREMLAKAQADGEKLATNIRMQAQTEAEEAKERAQRDIEASKNAAIAEIRQETAELATSIASKILRRNLNPDDQRQLVKESLEQLQTIKA
jgi:F-type H+-transporting ATPase subunit b